MRTEADSKQQTASEGELSEPWEVLYRPDRVVVPVGFEQLTELAREHLRQESERYYRWVEFMIAHDWLRDGFPPGDVY